ncbi:MAG: alpha-isopropylmalate synthase regulatory domain-containing protein, partial [Planctomycetaceae bacterium]
ETFQRVFDDFIALADKKKEVYDSDIQALVENRTGDTVDKWQFVSVHATAGFGTIPTATVEVRNEQTGEIHTDAATGGGPIEAVLHALERVTGISAQLEDLQIRSVSKGKDALGEVSVEISVNGRNFHGKGFSVDIVEGSARAYLNALNKAEVNRKPQEQAAVAAR